MKGLPIGPFEGFLVSRMDGRATVAEIADSTGATIEQVEQVVAQLTELGVLFVIGEDAQRGGSDSGFQRRSDKPSEAPAGARDALAPEPLFTQAELEEAGVDLDEPRRRSILQAYYELRESNHYEVLGVARDASKADIRAAYFALSKKFHPDTLFGKELGSFKPKMEAVFNALTEAYEALGKKKRRAEYDEYLGTIDVTRGVEESLDETERRSSVPEPPDELPPEFDAAPTDFTPPKVPSVPVPPEEIVAPRVAPTAEERRARARELMAMRMRGAQRTSVAQRRPATPPPAPPPERPVGETRKSILRGLARSLKGAAAVTGGVDKATQHLAHAREAEEKGDLLAATNSLRLALAVDDRPEIAAEYQRVKLELAASMASNYEKQAKYEEGYAKWAEAALSWTKVAEGRPSDPKPWRRAAEALMRADGDLKSAKSYAQKAVELAPESAITHRVLGEVFLRANMNTSAKRELDRAAKLDPKDEIVKTLLRELK